MSIQSIATASLLACAAASLAAADTPVLRVSSFLKPALNSVQDATPGIRRLTLDHSRLAQVREVLSTRGIVRIEEFLLPDGSSTTLELHPTRALAPGAKIVVHGEGKDRFLDMPESLLLTGTMDDDPFSLVMLSISDAGILGILEKDSGRVFISTTDTGVLIYDHAATVRDQPVDFARARCAVAAPNALIPRGESSVPAGGVSGSFDCVRLCVHLELDFELMRDAFSSDPLQAIPYIELLVATNSEIYKREVGFGWEISYWGMWVLPNEPWRVNPADLDEDESLIDVERNEFKDYMNSNPPPVPYDACVELSGRLLGGGLASFDSLCSDNAFAICEVDGIIPTPTRMRSSDNWDLIVFAHELGHICGARHTHDYSPPVDNCGNGDCTGAANGTIMSYCHFCSGGDANIGLRFDPFIQGEIIDAVASKGCLQGRSNLTIAHNDSAETVRNTSIVIDVLANDEIACGGRSISWHASVSDHGGVIGNASGGMLGWGRLYYRPPTGWVGTDRFKYRIGDASVGEATGEVEIVVRSQPNVADLLVIDTQLCRVARYDVATGDFIGILVHEGHGIEEPVGVSVGPGNSVLVTNARDGKILQFDGRSGVYEGVYLNSPAIDEPTRHAVRNGYLWVSNKGSDSITFVDFASGAVLDEFVTGLTDPKDVLMHSNGLLYAVANNGNDRVQARKANADLLFDTFCPAGGIVASAAAVGEAPNGDILVADGASHAIQRYIPGVHNWDTQFISASFASDLEFGFLTDLELGMDGLVYYAGEDRICRFDNDGNFVDCIFERGDAGMSIPGAIHYRPAYPSITGDLNLDFAVDGADLGIMLAQWGPNPDGVDEEAIADLDDSGVVDGADMGLMLANWTG